MTEAEERIWQQARTDNKALAALLQQHYPFLYKYMLKITMDRNLAEDLVQDTMLQAIENISAYEGRSKFSTWLIAIGTRLYMDAMRRKVRERKHQEAERLQALRSMKFMSAAAGGSWPEAMEALAELDYDIRVPIMLKHYYGYTVDEIAEWMNIPAGTVKSRMHNGLKKLRKELSANGSEA
ncbi:RNA polymerase sigma factor SigY [Paenibacillus sambharensis]|uniref:RNA polymerase sigma factor n=1 Tax=Paenibacillus sambharensis TaxID=1803190 RepID=A0A2W1L690_9BACL|nr:RNA polymerase sigma factor SigY [Paenibacillus sambharensis]PZD95688.1 RNA polymerase sigma factor SigY [Paenibacillus sambharensis]